MQAYEAVEKVERAVGVDPENPVIPVFLVVGGTLYLGYAQLNLCVPYVRSLSSISFLVALYLKEIHLFLVKDFISHQKDAACCFFSAMNPFIHCVLWMSTTIL